MPREESPARMQDMMPIPLSHMPRERQYNHPLVSTVIYARHQNPEVPGSLNLSSELKRLWR
eukprot:826644-Amphidinium_carterae.1